LKIQHKRKKMGKGGRFGERLRSGSSGKSMPRKGEPMLPFGQGKKRSIAKRRAGEDDGYSSIRRINDSKAKFLRSNKRGAGRLGILGVRTFDHS